MMALITRMTRLFRADIHAVLDRIEEPDQLLKQSLREMEEAFAADQQRARALQLEKEQIHRRQEELKETLEALEAQLDVCFSSDKDELARPLVRRKLGQQQQLKQLGQRASVLDDRQAELETRLQENQCQLESMRQKVELLATQESDLEPQAQWQPADSGIQDADVEVAFLHEKQKRGHP
jgi:phage shock protein A